MNAIVVSLSSGLISAIAVLIGNFFLKKYSWILDKKRFYEEMTYKEKLTFSIELSRALADVCNAFGHYVSMLQLRSSPPFTIQERAKLRQDMIKSKFYFIYQDDLLHKAKLFFPNTIIQKLNDFQKIIMTVSSPIAISEQDKNYELFVNTDPVKLLCDLHSEIIEELRNLINKQ